MKGSEKGIKPVFLLIVILFCTMYPAHCTLSYAAEASFTKLEKFFLEGKYENAVSASEKLIDSNASKRDEIYYLKGLSELKLKRFGSARDSFSKVIYKYPRSKLIVDARIGIADSHLLESNKHAALALYKDILRDYPRYDNSSVVRQRIDECEGRAITPVTNFTPASAAFSVQVGSFKNKSNAEKLMAKLRIQGYDSFMESPAAYGDNLYRVRVGRFSTNEEAQALASNLKKAGYPTKICSQEVCD